MKNNLLAVSNVKKNFFSTSLSLSGKEDKGKGVATNEWLAEQEKKQKDLEDLQKHKDEQIKSDHELASSLYYEEWGKPHYEGESEHSSEKGRNSRSVSPDNNWEKKVISALLFEADTCEKEGDIERAEEYRKEVMVKLEELEKKASGTKGESSSSAVAESSSSKAGSAQPDKKSPLDYILEKEEGEMPGPGDDFD